MNNISFSADEIYIIMENKTKKYLKMTNEELKEYFKNQDEKFYNNEKNNNIVVSV